MQDYEELNIQQKASEGDPFTEERYRLFYKFMPKHARDILDIGCNTGRGGETLKGLNRDFILYGLDVVKERLDRLPAGIYKEYIHGSSTAIPLADCSLDAAIAGEFIEHLYPMDVDLSLAEIFRTLRIGGRILLTTPNPGDIKLRLRGGSVLGGAHISQHHPDMLRTRLRMIGFDRVRIMGSGKVTRYLGCRFPLLSIYGSYLAIADKF